MISSYTISPTYDAWRLLSLLCLACVLLKLRVTRALGPLPHVLLPLTCSTPISLPPSAPQLAQLLDEVARLQGHLLPRDLPASSSGTPRVQGSPTQGAVQVCLGEQHARLAWPMLRPFKGRSKAVHHVYCNDDDEGEVRSGPAPVQSGAGWSCGSGDGIAGVPLRRRALLTALPGSLTRPCP
jgi:hypothetical protein